MSDQEEVWTAVAQLLRAQLTESVWFSTFQDVVPIVSDDHALVVALPAGLANGTYTVAWHNVSAADGHPKDGFFAFTIGTVADVGEAVAVESDLGGPPAWLKTVSRCAFDHM